MGRGQPGELAGNLRPGSCSKSRGSPRHVAARAPIGAGRARRGVPVRPRRDGWAPRSAQEAPRATRVNFGRGARMWGGYPGPLSRLLGPASPSVPGRGVGTWTVAIWALPVRHLLRGRGYFCPPAGARAGKGARWSAALTLGAGPVAVAGGPKRVRGRKGGRKSTCEVLGLHSKLRPQLPSCKLRGFPPHLTRVGVALSLGHHILEIILHLVSALKPSFFTFWVAVGGVVSAEK